jgi:hypothetical protein
VKDELDIPTPLPKYVAYCDVLGFSNSVLANFEIASRAYAQFRSTIRDFPFHKEVRISMYSDSIVIVSDKLNPVLSATQTLWFVALANQWMLRGGIAYGHYWERKEDGNVFVVSDALVRAVRVEKSIKVPAIGVSDEVVIDDLIWAVRWRHGIFVVPVLHYEGRTIANPFNLYWFTSAKMRARTMLEEFPDYREKYEWFLSLSESVGRDDILVPDEVMQRLLERGVIERRTDPTT